MGQIDDAIDGARRLASAYRGTVAAFQVTDQDEDSQEYWDLPECAATDNIIRVHCQGGGPAGGVEFELDNNGSWMAAHTWYQDWGTPKGYAELDEDTADFLFTHWGFDA